MESSEKELMGTGKVAAMLGISRHRLIWLLDNAKVPDVDVRVPGRRLFTQSETERIRKALSRMQEAGQKCTSSCSSTKERQE